MKRFLFVSLALPVLMIAGCGGTSVSQRADSISQVRAEHSPEARNSLCDLISPRAVADVVRESVSVDVISPENQPPLTCQYSGGGIQVTVMATVDADAAAQHALNAEGIAEEDRLAAFDELGDGGTGFVFNDTVSGDAYQGNVWMNVSVDSAVLSEEEKLML